MCMMNMDNFDNINRFTCYAQVIYQIIIYHISNVADKIKQQNQGLAGIER